MVIIDIILGIWGEWSPNIYNLEDTRETGKPVTKSKDRNKGEHVQKTNSIFSSIFLGSTRGLWSCSFT